MKKLLALLALTSASLFSCVQQNAAVPVFYKPMSGAKSLAVPPTTQTVGVVANGAFAGGAVTNSHFLEALKQELRARGWRLVVQGVTGRAGATQSINSGAAYTLDISEAPNLSCKTLVLAIVTLPFRIFGADVEVPQSAILNCALIENKTGEEVMLLKGYAGDVKKLAKEIADAITKK
jgi:hypothetical protein